MIFNGQNITLAGARSDGTQVFARKNGVDGNPEAVDPSVVTSTDLYLGHSTNPGIYGYYHGYMGEFLIFPYAMDAERTNLEDNQTNYSGPPSLRNVSIASNNTAVNRAKVGDTVTLSFRSNKPITSPTVTIGGKSAIVSNLNGNNWNAKIVIDNSVANGVLAFSIANYVDSFNIAGAAFSITNDSSSVTVDKTQPSSVFAQIYSNNLRQFHAKTGDSITLSFGASEPIKTPSFNIGGKIIIPINTAGNEWRGSIVVDSTIADGIITFSISYEDLTGNAGTNVTTTTNSSQVTVDKVAPAITGIRIKSNNIDTTIANNGDRITLIFTASDAFPVSPTVVIAGKTATLYSIGANVWEAEIIVDTNCNHGLVSFTINGIDNAGNASPTYTATNNSSAVTIIPIQLCAYSVPIISIQV